MDWVAISHLILDVIKQAAFGEEKKYEIDSKQSLGDYDGIENMNTFGIAHKDLDAKLREKIIKKLMQKYDDLNEEPTHLLNNEWFHMLNLSMKELIKNRVEIMWYFIDNQLKNFYQRFKDWKATNAKVKKIEERLGYFASDIDITINLKAWCSQLVASNDLCDIDYNVFELKLERFLEMLSKLVTNTDYNKLSCIEGIKFNYVSYKEINKTYVNQIETYMAQSRLLDTKVKRILTAKFVKSQYPKDWQTEEEYLADQNLYEEPPDKIELVLLLSYHKDLGIIYHSEILRSLLADRTDFGINYSNYSGFSDIMPSLNMLKNDLHSNFLEAILKHINIGLDMYKYADMKFKKFRNFSSYYNTSGKDVLMADFIVHLANQFVETPIIDTI